MQSFNHQLLKLFILVLLTTVNSPVYASEGETDAYFQERANLALREVAHRMLWINGDSTSQIPAVRTSDGLQFIIRFPGELRYDTLRRVIDQTLENAGLPLRYDLAIYDCIDEALILGFMALPQNNEGNYACQERKPTTQCVDIAIRFPGQGNQFAASVGWLGGIGTLVSLVALGWWRRQRNEQSVSEVVVNNNKAPTVLKFGNSLFHVQEQKIILGQEEKKLTYREAKLLHYFCQKPNEVLPREQILGAVWGEEGVQVTRSLDMFVSRLRKILKQDPLIQIASVHGVGYRFITR